MKRYFLPLLAALALLLALSLPAAAEDGAEAYIYDLTGYVLTEEEGNALQDRAAELSGRSGTGIYIVVLEDYTEYGSSPARASENIYSRYGFGAGEDRSGILLLMSMEDRDYDVGTRGYCTYAMSLVDQDDFEAPMLDRFRVDDWYGGFAAFLDCCDALLKVADASYDPADYAANGAPARSGPNVGINAVIGLVIGLVAALIVCSAGKAKMKTVHAASDASGYTVPNSMHLRVRQDQFTHTTQSRVKIESSSSGRSSSGGGGRPSGGSSHHSGKF